MSRTAEYPLNILHNRTNETIRIVISFTANKPGLLGQDLRSGFKGG
jgi:hypothetical protein